MATGNTQTALREAVNEVLHHQFTHSRPAMHALQVLIDAADSAADEIERLWAALQEADTIMGHDDVATEWRERWASLWAND